MKNLIQITIFLILAIFVTNQASAQVATNEGQSVLQKVKEKVETLKKAPKALIGTITDKTDTAIQLKNINGSIELVSIIDTTKFVRLGSNETAIKFTDIAIGDFVAALGTYGNTQTLSARRVLLNPGFLQTKRIVIVGQIGSIVKRVITVNSTGETHQFIFPARWKGPEIKDLNAGDSVAVIAITEGNKSTIRTIEIVSSPSLD